VKIWCSRFEPAQGVFDGQAGLHASIEAQNLIRRCWPTTPPINGQADLNLKSVAGAKWNA
jgi:hypothetical protein